jgi:Carboxypeptidase regulatory-like domain
MHVRVEARPRACAHLFCALLLICGVACLAPSPTTAAGTGAVRGVVHDGTTEAQIAGIEVCVRATSEPLAPPTCAATDAAGKYEIAALAEGQYLASFSAPAESGLNYLTQYFKGRSTEALADPVSVAEETTTDKVNASMQAGGEIKGTVAEGEGTTVAGIKVCALEKGLEAPVRCIQTNASGEYTIAGLASGDYEVEFSTPGYVTQFFEAAVSREQAKSVAVTAGAAAVEGVSAVLQPVPPPTGAIEGAVSSAATSVPLSGVQVCARSIVSSLETCAVTAASGAYTIAVLPVGLYTVHFLPFEAGSSYAPQFFENTANEADAEPVSVIADSTVSGVDAVLQGIPVAVLRPAIAGAAAEGQMLRLLPGTWTNAPTLTDEWGQCDATGVIETCHTIATTPTYMPTAADVGCTIRIREQASNEFGLGTPLFLFSPPTAPVTTASGRVGPCRPTPSASPPWTMPPAIDPATGVSPLVAHAASSAQLKALLMKLLVPHGKRAKLAALRSHRSYVATFSSLAAGRLSISWYLAPKGAHASTAKPKPKPRLVASGKLTTKASGTARLAIKVTAAGRALLAKGKPPLKLTAKGAFAPQGRSTLRATRTFTLKR